MEVKWMKEPEKHDYPAAESFLRLLKPNCEVAEIVKKLQKKDVVMFKAKDIFRASEVSLLSITNSHVAKDHQKIIDGKKLSPLLLVRDKQTSRTIIADGYHRLCAVYGINEDADIPVKIV